MESTFEPKKKPYPKGIYFIIGNEFCERFSFYGLKTILTLYLTQRLFYSDSAATMIFHLFVVLTYFTPVFGAIIADSWLGKYRTILYISILYACGYIILSFGAFLSELNTTAIVSLVGLFIIGLGSGIIKPCVSAFGGDQFKSGQEKQLQRFFSFFYVAINLGFLVSTFLTPYLREDVHCLGENTCFPLAFGVSALLMVVAFFFCICGKPFYIMKPPEGNIVVKVSKCIYYALLNKAKSSEKKKSHWLDYAEDKYDKKLIEDIKILFHVLVLYIPLPLFWALFDQQASTWTLQATRLNGKINDFHLKPDQVLVLNPLLIILFIPLFDYVIYPLLAKCHILEKPLQRMTVGGLLAALSFVVAGFIELNLEESLPVLPSCGHSQLMIINNSPCTVQISGTDFTLLDEFAKTALGEMPQGQEHGWTFSGNCSSGTATPKQYELSFNLSSQIESMMITVTETGTLTAIKTNDTKTKADNGEPLVRFFYSIDPMNNGENITFYLSDGKHEYYIDTGKEDASGITDFCTFIPGEYNIYLPLNETAFQEIPIATETFKSGGVYIVSIYSKENEMSVSSKYTSVSSNELSILLQIPQYVIITAGEILLAITGLEFSYSQSPNSMKSVVQSAWLLTVAIGNLIVIVIEKLDIFEKQSHYLFLFAVMMCIDMLLFVVLAYFYKYVTIKTGSEEDMDTSRPLEKSKESAAKNFDDNIEETDFNE